MMKAVVPCVLAAALLVVGCSSSPDPAAERTSTEDAALETPSVPPNYAELVAAAGPIAHWPLDDTTGDVAADAGPGGFDATYAGGVVLGEEPAVAGGGSSVRVDGESGHVFVAGAGAPAATALAPADGLSVELWCRPARLPRGADVDQLARWRWYGWSIRIAAGRISADVWQDAASDPDSTDPRQIIVTGPRLEAGQWHHVVLTQDEAAVRLYLDGVPVAETASVGPLYAPVVDPKLDPTGTGGGVALGRDADTRGQYFDGWLDEVAVYPLALSAEVIASHAALADG
jgi:hypothetical protein